MKVSHLVCKLAVPRVNYITFLNALHAVLHERRSLFINKTLIEYIFKALYIPVYIRDERRERESKVPFPWTDTHSDVAAAAAAASPIIHNSSLRQQRVPINFSARADNHKVAFSAVVLWLLCECMKIHCKARGYLADIHDIHIYIHSYTSRCLYIEATAHCIP